MNIGIIGAGKLGSALAIALSKSEFGISGVFSKSEESCQLLCEKLGMAMVNSFDTAVLNSDVIFLCIPDNYIDSMALKIAAYFEAELIKGKVFLHLSGALTSEVLRPLENMGAFTGSFHPIQTFADRDNSWQKLYNCFFGFEGCGEAGECAKTIADRLNGRVISIRREQKTLYHAAACMISNYSVTLFYIMRQMLIKTGMDEDEAVKAFMPLLKNTVDNIERLGDIDALTGPISRGDYKVVSQHLESISNEIPEYEDIYRLLGRETIKIALQKGNINEVDVLELNEVLGNKE
jgi:predicted short-subunit dehydrogenase-like oxidoreductase (DUF2520 family)